MIGGSGRGAVAVRVPAGQVGRMVWQSALLLTATCLVCAAWTALLTAPAPLRIVELLCETAGAFVLYFVGNGAVMAIAIVGHLLVEESNDRHCSCGYDLSGAAVRRCPECGRSIDPQVYRRLKRWQMGHRIAVRWPDVQR